jgi:hypothetical protein
VKLSFTFILCFLLYATVAFPQEKIEITVEKDKKYNLSLFAMKINSGETKLKVEIIF